MALWDIKGKVGQYALYDLFSGKSREGVAVYRHADGRDLDTITENVQKVHGSKHQQCKDTMGGYGGDAKALNKPAGVPDGVYYCPDQYI